jgi:hypothetical protein
LNTAARGTGLAALLALLASAGSHALAGAPEPVPDPAVRSADETAAGPAVPAARPGHASGGETDDPRPDPTARLPKGSGPGESYRLAALLDGGSFLFTRFLITNVGPGKRNAVATGLWIEPDGTVHEFDNARREHEWQLADDRLRLDVGSSHLDLRGPFARYEVTKKRIQVDVQVPLDARLEMPPGLAPDGARFEILSLGAPLVGTLDGRKTGHHELRGTALLTHEWSRGTSEPARRITVQASAGGERVLLIHHASRSDPPVAWLVWLDETSVRAVESVSVVEEGRLGGDRGRGYKVPTRLRLSGTAEGEIHFGELLFERSLLGSFPQPLRSLVSWTLDERPLSVWARATINVTLRANSGGDTRHFRGEGAAAISFTDKLPDR